MRTPGRSIGSRMIEWLRQPRRFDAGRQLEGWQLGALIVIVAAVFTAIVVPRTALPERLPPSAVTFSELDEARARNRKVAREATPEMLPNVVQLLGARLRVFGRAELEQPEQGTRQALSELATAASVALLRERPETLTALRAYEAELFAVAYCDFLRTGRLSEDVIELGGSLNEEIARHGWFRGANRSEPQKIDGILRALFKRRFNKLVGQHPALAPDAVEERVLLEFMLAHPPRGLMPLSRGEGADVRGEDLLKWIDELSQLEPTYPALYAKGIVYFRMQRYEAAALCFEDYVRSVANGPYHMRAINYMKAAIERSEGY